MPEKYIICQRKPVSEPLSSDVLAQVAEEYGAKVLVRVDGGILVEMEVDDVNRLGESHPDLVIMHDGAAVVIRMRSLL